MHLKLGYKWPGLLENPSRYYSSSVTACSSLLGIYQVGVPLLAEAPSTTSPTKNFPYPPYPLPPYLELFSCLRTRDLYSAPALRPKLLVHLVLLEDPALDLAQTSAGAAPGRLGRLGRRLLVLLVELLLARGEGLLLLLVGCALARVETALSGAQLEVGEITHGRYANLRNGAGEGGNIV